MTEQDIVALTLVGFAAFLLVRKFFGKAPAPERDSAVSPRLRRGLERAEALRRGQHGQAQEIERSS